MIPPPGESDGPGLLARYDTISSGRSEGIGGDKYYDYIDDPQEQAIRICTDCGREAACTGTSLRNFAGKSFVTFQTTNPCQRKRANISKMPTSLSSRSWMATWLSPYPA